MKIELEFFKFEELSKKAQKCLILYYKDVLFDEWEDYNWAKSVEREFERELEQTFTFEVRSVSLAREDSWHIYDDVDMVGLSVFPIDDYWENFEHISDHKEVRQLIEKYIKKAKDLRDKLQSDDKVIARIVKLKTLYTKEGSIFRADRIINEAAFPSQRVSYYLPDLSPTILDMEK